MAMASTPLARHNLYSPVFKMHLPAGFFPIAFAWPPCASVATATRSTIQHGLLDSNPFSAGRACGAGDDGGTIRRARVGEKRWAARPVPDERWQDGYL
jgi:hypothetical protein